MSSWYANIVTRTTSQISSLRSTLLSSEQDGETDDDTHVCRVLRNHYADKGRPLPHWLPGDPRAAAPQALYAPSSSARYHGVASAPPGGAGLSSLWDSPAQQAQPQPQQQSLRAGGRRPVPSREDARPVGQRAGSYSGGASSPGPASAQDRLKQRLWGGSRQPSPLQSGQSQFQPPNGPRGYSS